MTPYYLSLSLCRLVSNSSSSSLSLSLSLSLSIHNNKCVKDVCPEEEKQEFDFATCVMLVVHKRGVCACVSKKTRLIATSAFI